MPRNAFNNLLRKYTDDLSLITELWTEVEKAYTHKKRHYHTLGHLEHLLVQLSDVKQIVREWDAMLFSLFYHDIVYDVLRTDNEQKSAEFASKAMVRLAVDANIMALAEQTILATAKHEVSANEDVNIFTDADLSALGQPWELYSVYSKNIRKEYSIYPDLVYKPGRKKVLKHFLEMERIFKTGHFSKLYEEQARHNMRRELEMLK